MYGLITPVATIIAKRDAYLAKHSLRFDGSADYLNRVVTASNRTTWTWSAWVKKNDLGVRDYLFSGGAAGDVNNLFYIQWEDNTSPGATSYRGNNLKILWREGSGTTQQLTTTATFEDTTSWFHLVLALDTTQAAASDKMKLYIDGAEVTSFVVDNRDTIGLNDPLSVNAAGNLCMGAYAYDLTSTTSRFKGQMAEVHFVDGTAYDETYFGETRGGVWLPKQVTGVTYGNNGFYLDFKGNDTGVVLLMDGTSKTTDLSSENQTISETSTHTSLSNETDPFGDTQDVLDFSKGDATNGSGLVVSNAPIVFGNDPFTVEMFIKLDTTDGTHVNHTLYSDRDASNTIVVFRVHQTGQLQFFKDNSGGGLFTGSSTLTTGTWYHVALTYDGSTVRMFLDGNLDGSSSQSLTFNSSANPVLGYDPEFPDTVHQLDGRMAQVRITKGVARYTNNFTAPTSDLTNTVSSGTVELRMDGTDGAGSGSTTTDLSSFSHTGITSTDVTAGTTDSGVTRPDLYGSTKGYLDFTSGASGRIVTLPTTVDLSSGDFTIECWVLFDTISDFRSFMRGGTGSSSGAWQLQVYNSNISLLTGGASTYSITDSKTVTTNTWYHVALSYVSSTYTMTLSVDGVGTTLTDQTEFSNMQSSYLGGSGTNIELGANRGGTVRHDGLLTDVRFTTGAALYPVTGRIGELVPPTSALTNTPEYLGDFGVDRSTDGTGVVLLLDGDNNITDFSSSAHTMSWPVSSAYHSSGKFNQALDLTSTFLEGPTTTQTSDFQFGTGDFTLESWIYWPSGITTDDKCLFESRSSAADAGLVWFFQGNTNGTLTHRVYNSNVLQNASSTGSFSLNTWHHVALVRSGNEFTYFTDGQAVGSFTFTGSVNQIASDPLRIGGRTDSTTTPVAGFQGYVDDFRITKGVARYTSNFTPPTSALTNDNTWDKPKNNFTVNGNITPDDQLLDTPNLRFASLDPSTVSDGSALSNANLTHDIVGTASYTLSDQSFSSGKYYSEISLDNVPSPYYAWVGVSSVTTWNGGYVWGVLNDAATGKALNATNENWGTKPVVGDVIQIAIDMDNGKIWWGLNGTWQEKSPNGTPDPAAGTGAAFTGLTGTMRFGSQDGTNNDHNTKVTWNFGQDHTFAGAKSALLTPYSDANGNGEFYYQPPSGFLALATAYK